jgi:hypothetical protein
MKNSRKILIYSIFSLVFFFSLFILNAQAADSDAVLFFSASSKIINKGDEININIEVNSPNQNINAVSGSFKIPKNFQLESILTTNSIVDFWLNEPKVANGLLSFEGVTVRKPFQGDSGLIFTMKGIALEKGTLAFNFDDGTILADDGLGTNVLSSLGNISLAVKDNTQIAVTINPIQVSNNTSPKEINNANSLSIAKEESPEMPALFDVVSQPVQPAEKSAVPYFIYLAAAEVVIMLCILFFV